MSLEINIKKELGDFALDMEFKTEARRFGILGASGSGKSMTMRMIAGIDMPDFGRISYNGEVFFDASRRINKKPGERNVGYLFQSYALFPNMSVEKNIEIGIRGRTKAEKRDIVDSMLERFRISELGKRMPSQLSGGQRQRVAIARMMAYEPGLILFDEPFSALDYHLRDVMQEELIEMLDSFDGQAVLVSHSRDEIYKFCDEMVVIDEGKACALGKTADIFRDPKTVRAAVLIGCKNIAAAEIRDPHTVYIPEWDLTLRADYEFDRDLKYIGYKAHYFEPVWDDEPGINRIPFDLRQRVELPFDVQYYINAGEGQICYFLSYADDARLFKDGYPKYLELKQERFLQLR